MPPKSSRTRRGGATTGNQSTLSFKNRVTKSTPTVQSDSKSKPGTRLSDAAKEELIETTTTQADPEPVSIEPSLEPEEATTVEPQIELELETTTALTPRKKKRVSAASSIGVDAREAQAENITDAQISKWWKQEEQDRRAPRGTIPSHSTAYLRDHHIPPPPPSPSPH
jgi:hypothetical protein